MTAARRSWEPARPVPAGAVDPLATRVLLALGVVYAVEGRAGVREVAAAAGLGLGHTHRALRRLRHAGLVAWEPGRHGTLRPLVELARGERIAVRRRNPPPGLAPRPN